jgi:hypothetical protein
MGKLNKNSRIKKRIQNEKINAFTARFTLKIATFWAIRLVKNQGVFDGNLPFWGNIGRQQNGI